MGLIKLGSDNKLYFSGGKYNGRLINDVARSDHNYLRWVRQNCTDRLPSALWEAFECVIKVNGITPAARKK